MKSKICELLNIKYPILQGAMAWISEAVLAAAVSNAGGLGIIAGGNAPTEVVRAEIIKAKSLTDKPFGVNIMLMSPYVSEIAELICAEGVAAVTTGAGNPGKYIEAWKKAGTKIIPVVPSVGLAQRMEKAGADAVIAEGCESGGHVGEMTTMALVPQVADGVGIPVIAAGGIADGRGIAAAFALGASGVQVGTRFLVAKECQVHGEYKKMVMGAKDIDTIVTGRVTGHPVRVLKNGLARQMQKAEKDGITAEEFEELGVGALARAARDGDTTTGSVMAGQIAGLVKREQTASEIIEEMWEQYKIVARSQASEA
ncbi:MAG: enoyl-[acyl-carrier-protein] reductase FabK [Clostridiales bacterium]|jgi:enoyl-[acyl-carrier protein] reductase II|nr:enoyl-[acyl-carrier-protein] reductase FabK [Clostridiales bacterium]